MVGEHGRCRASNCKTILLAAVLMAAGTLASATGSPEWELRSDAPEQGGAGQAMVGTGDYLYVVKTAGRNSAPDFWRYNPSGDLWDILSTSGLGDGVFRNGAAIEWDGGDRLYVLAGGYYSDDARKQVWRYDIPSDSWTRLGDGPCPQGAGTAAAWSDTDGAMYAIMGSSGHGRCFARYDPAGDVWTVLQNTPGGVDDGASLEWASLDDGRYVYALSGEYFESSPLQDFWRYDTITDTWDWMTDIPEDGGVGDGASLLWVGDFDSSLAGSIFALGGGDSNESPGYSVYQYELATDSWTTLPDLPYPVGDHNGNRLGYAGGSIHYTQLSPSSYSGGGDKVARLLGVGCEVDCDPPDPDPQNLPPEADFVVECLLTYCSFTDQSTDPDGNVSSWHWHFGDGTLSDEKHPEHLYMLPGVYEVELVVTDDEGEEGKVVKMLGASPMQ